MILEQLQILNYSDIEPENLNFEGIYEINEDSLEQFTRQNSPYQFELTSEGQLIIMSPTFSSTGIITTKFLIHLGLWNEKHQLGICFDSSTGFKLPNNAIRSPDISWMSKEKWEQLSIKEQKSFAPQVPDFIIEVRSATDSLKILQEKMKEWMANGCLLSWLIDPKNQKVYIYRKLKEPDVISSFESVLTGENLLEGFSFDLNLLKAYL